MKKIIIQKQYKSILLSVILSSNPLLGYQGINYFQYGEDIALSSSNFATANINNSFANPANITDIKQEEVTVCVAGKKNQFMAFSIKGVLKDNIKASCNFGVTNAYEVEKKSKAFINSYHLSVPSLTFSLANQFKNLSYGVKVIIGAYKYDMTSYDPGGKYKLQFKSNFPYDLVSRVNIGCKYKYDNLTVGLSYCPSIDGQSVYVSQKVFLLDSEDAPSIQNDKIVMNFQDSEVCVIGASYANIFSQPVNLHYSFVLNRASSGNSVGFIGAVKESSVFGYKNDLSSIYKNALGLEVFPGEDYTFLVSGHYTAYSNIKDIDNNVDFKDSDFYGIGVGVKRTIAKNFTLQASVGYNQRVKTIKTDDELNFDQVNAFLFSVELKYV